MVDLDAIVALSDVIDVDAKEPARLEMKKLADGKWEITVHRERFCTTCVGSTPNEAGNALQEELQGLGLSLVERLGGLLRRWSKGTAKVLRLAKGEDDAG